MCPNGVSSSIKIKRSLEKLQAEKKKRLNHSSTCDPASFDKVDQTVCICASQFRDLKGSAGKCSVPVWGRHLHLKKSY